MTKKDEFKFDPSKYPRHNTLERVRAKVEIDGATIDEVIKEFTRLRDKYGSDARVILTSDEEISFSERIEIITNDGLEKEDDYKARLERIEHYQRIAHKNKRK